MEISQRLMFHLSLLIKYLIVTNIRQVQFQVRKKTSISYENIRVTIINNIIKKIIPFLIVILMTSTIQAQTQYLEPNKNYNVAKIYQRGVSAIKVTDLIFTNDSLIQYKITDNTGTTREMLLSASNVRYISVKKGNHAATYGLYGAAVGLLSSLYAVLDVKSDPYLDDSGVDWAPFVLGFTAGGAAIGVIVGLFVPKWQYLYIPEDMTSFTIRLSPAINKDFYSLGVNITF